MNSPVLQEVTLATPATFDAGHFRESIAQRCANILHGCHHRKIKMAYKISPILTGVTINEMGDSTTFESHIRERLAILLGLELERVSVTVSSTPPEDDTKKSQQHDDKSEEYLHLRATVKRK